MKLALFIAAGAMIALGEDARLTGPVAGYVFDRSSQSIRPILGVLGSSHLGDAVAGSFDLASPSPLGIYALATQAGRLFFVRNLDSGQAESAPIDNAISGANRFAWNQDGTSAAIYSADSRQAQVVRNLSTTPTLDDAIDLSSLDGTVSALAFDGKRLLIGASSPASGGVYLADGQSAPKLLLRTAVPVALSVDAARGDLYIADHDSSQIWMVQGYAGDATPILFAADRDGVSSPVGLRASGGRLLVANAGNRGVDAIDIATRASLGHMDLDFAPVQMEALGSGQLTLLNFSGADGPLYVLDSTGDLAVYFVPAGGDR
jgi:VCBS repeat-containing protein